MERVVRILMKRDGLSREEATELVNDTVAEIMDDTNILDTDEILMDNLGLEPDYLPDLLF